MALCTVWHFLLWSWSKSVLVSRFQPFVIFLKTQSLLCCLFWLLVPPSGADSAFLFLFCACHEKRFLQFDICLIHHFYAPQFTTRSVMFYRCTSLSFCLFDYAGYAISLKYNWWRHLETSFLLWEKRQHLPPQRKTSLMQMMTLFIWEPEIVKRKTIFEDFRFVLYNDHNEHFICLLKRSPFSCGSCLWVHFCLPARRNALEPFQTEAH